MKANICLLLRQTKSRVNNLAERSSLNSLPVLPSGVQVTEHSSALGPDTPSKLGKHPGSKARATSSEAEQLLKASEPSHPCLCLQTQALALLFLFLALSLLLSCDYHSA